MKGSIDVSTTGIVNAFSVGLKSGYYQLIESMSVDLNQRNIVQLQNNLNILTNYRVLTSFSQDDLNKYGSILGLYPDSAGSYKYSATASLNGDGYSNNVITPTLGSPFEATPNEGGFKRLLTTSAFNSASAIVEATANSAQEARTYYVVSTDAGAAKLYNWLVLATIRLKDICPFFSHVPLMKTANYRFIINYNSSITTITIDPDATAANATMVTTTVQMLSGQTNPIFIPSIAVGSPNEAFATLNGGTAYTLTVSCNVVKNSLNNSLLAQFATCRLYVPAYEIEPIYESSLIDSMPRTKIEYTDYFVYRVTNISSGAPFNSLLTNGIVCPKAIIVIPFANQGSAASVNALNLPQYQMPFDSAPATSCPNASLTAFNIQVNFPQPGTTSSGFVRILKY